jgi:AraC family transcriptional regulator
MNCKVDAMQGPNTQTAYKVCSDRLCIAGVLRQFDCVAEEHEHSEAQLTVLFRGKSPSVVSHNESGRTTRTGILAGSFVFVAPDQPHRLNWSDDGEVLHLWIPKQTLSEISEQIGCPIPASRLGDQPDRSVHEIGRILMNEFNTTGGLAPTMVNHACSLMLSHVLRTSNQLSREVSSGLLSRERLQPAIDLISECPEYEFTLLELAGLCHSSVFHFARSFTARLGCAPFAFQRTLRLKKARQLLVTTELSVEAVGTAVGFQNPTHFSRLFRRDAGYSPRDYRRFRNSADLRNS